MAFTADITPSSASFSASFAAATSSSAAATVFLLLATSATFFASASLASSAFRQGRFILSFALFHSLL